MKIGECLRCHGSLTSDHSCLNRRVRVGVEGAAAHIDRVWNRWLSKYDELRRKPKEAAVIRSLLEQDFEKNGVEALEQWDVMTMTDLLARLIVMQTQFGLTAQQAILEILRAVPNLQTHQIHINLERRGFRLTTNTTIRFLRQLAEAGKIVRSGEHPAQTWRLKA